MSFETLADLSNICFNIDPSRESEKIYNIQDYHSHSPLNLIYRLYWKYFVFIYLQETVMIHTDAVLRYWCVFFFGILWTGLSWKEYIKTVRMILFSRLSFADGLCRGGKNALFQKSFWSSGKPNISNVLLSFELPHKKIPENFIF